MTVIPALVLLALCSGNTGTKVPVHAWLGGPKQATDAELAAKFADLKTKGVDALLYSAGHDPAVYRRLGKLAKAAGLGFQAWIPTLVQEPEPGLKPEWYAVNGKGESAFDKPAYVDHYKFLCPAREEVYLYLEELYGRVADVPEVDAVHLDFIRFPDVILAKGLWKKYGLVQDREYPQFDYCYCDVCVAEFKKRTGIDIRAVEDPSRIEEWKRFRYDLITRLVNRLAGNIRARGKRITAAVFPGPGSVAVRIVRQEWDKWDLDAFYPMNYNDFYLEGTAWIGAMCKQGVEALKGKAPLYSGLFICPDPAAKSLEPDPENHGLLPGEMAEAVRESMANGATGICLFAPDRMTADHWAELGKALRGDPRR
jgi:hypothetical protein